MPKKFATYGTRHGSIATELTPNSYLIRKPIQRGIPLRKTDVPELHYGQHIYLYNNIQTNQVVYSLSRHLNVCTPISRQALDLNSAFQNKDSLDQLPYLGKKTVPPRLRKDLWSPFAMVYFPSPHAGLAAYRKLREFRRLHETSYDLRDITEKTGKYAGSLYPTQKRGRVLMNQKANSIADLASVLLQQERGPREERVANAERRIQIVERLKKQKGKNKVKKNPLDVKKELEGVEGVCVRWADMLDAEYAETWPQDVVHDALLKSRHTAAWPAKEEPIKEEEPVIEEQDTAPIRQEEKPGEGWRDYISSWIPGRARTAPMATA